MALIPFDDRDGWIWLDGQLVPWRDARLHVLSHGLHYASSVFEGERAYRGNIFRLRDHTERLLNSARLLMFEIPYTAEQIDTACRQVLEANGLTDGYVRPVAWRGTEQLAVSPSGTTIHTAIAAWPWPSYFEGERMAGIRMMEGTWRRPPPDTAPTQSKASALYMIGSLNKLQAEQAGYADALLLDWRGYVAEATGANIFLVIDGELHTPSCEAFLDGLTRKTVISLARRAQMKVVERHIQPAELARATEVFVTGTAAEVTAVREIGDHCFTPGRITEALMQGYDDLVLCSPEAVDRVVAA
ncbi:branched-chain amino acid aminotransferase [Rhodopila sp.]|jgi:branched-chain amino acid aminotransferase|uniref:branched-chain amino acid aminotransferase n=1 Tax=Rhodopila sp. TaxID=2480087 RepID=UPI002C6C32CA|nr:branched-chain amino acid aminotransferase [Rhodopila sp.]HVZ09453.1 branched-chain amino acid aminotransferase [Rhodopila sp.]